MTASSHQPSAVSPKMVYIWGNGIAGLALLLALLIASVLAAARLGGQGVALRYGQVDERGDARYTYVDIERGLQSKQRPAVAAALLPVAEVGGDGRRVTARQNGGNFDLYLVEADGTQRQLTHFSDFPSGRMERAARRSNQYPAWSPDGAWITFVSADVNGRLSLYAVRPGGGGLRHLGERIRVSGDLLPRWVRLE